MTNTTSEMAFTERNMEYAQKVEANEMNPIKSVYLGLFIKITTTPQLKRNYLLYYD